MAAKLSDTRHVTGPDDKLAAVDVYGVTDNSIKALQSGASIDPSSLVSNLVVPGGLDPLAMAKLVGGGLGIAGPYPTFDRNSFLSGFGVGLDRFSQTLKDLLGPFGYLLDINLLTMANQLNMLNGFGQTSSLFNLNGITSLLSGWNIGGSNFNLSSGCALLGLAGLFLSGNNGRDNGASLLLLLLLLSKLIECFIIEPLNSIFGSINNNALSSMVAGLVLGKAINPAGSSYYNNETNYYSSFTNSFSADRYLRTSYGKQDSISNAIFGFVSGAKPKPGPWSLNKSSYSTTTSNKVNHGITLGQRIPEGTAPYRSYGFNGVAPVAGGVAPVNSEVRGMDLDFVEALLQYCDIAMINQAYPTLVENLFYYYRLPLRKAYTLEGEYNRLTAVANLVDPTWDSYTRDGQPVSSLACFNRASLDTLKVFSGYTGSEYIAEALIASSYRNNRIDLFLRKQYPNAYIA